jgi:polyketide biosynthesis acyl carrier protein
MSKEEVFKLITQHCRNIVPTLKDHNIQRSDRFKEIGINSLDRAEIIEIIMEDLNLECPRVEVFGAKNIGELADIFYEKTLSAL